MLQTIDYASREGQPFRQSSSSFSGIKEIEEPIFLPNSLEFGANSRFCSVLSHGGSEILSPLESGVNSRFCSVKQRGIRNSASV